jgi:hypothetical protein
LADPLDQSQHGDQLLQKQSFFSLLEQIRADFLSEQATENRRLLILQALLRLTIYDEPIMTKTQDLIANDKVTAIPKLTNYLWVLAKFKS